MVLACLGQFLEIVASILYPVDGSIATKYAAVDCLIESQAELRVRGNCDVAPATNATTAPPNPGLWLKCKEQAK